MNAAHIPGNRLPHAHDFLIGLVLSGLVGMFPVMQANAQSADALTNSGAASPCLQALNQQKGDKPQEEKKAPEGPNWFSRNAGAILGGLGAVGGALAGKALCKNKPGDRTGCLAVGAVGGALLGSKLGNMLSEADKKRYQAATYKVALTGRPQSVTLDKGCMVVEPASTETFEVHQIALALEPGVSAPQTMRAVAEPFVRPSASSLAADPATSAGATQVAANVPTFVMGSTEAGRRFLLGREDPDQGYVGAGYVEAQGWVPSPDSTPTAPDGPAGQPRLVKVGVEVPCRQISSSIRVEASNTTETYPGKVCRLPNGVAETQ